MMKIARKLCSPFSCRTIISLYLLLSLDLVVRLKALCPKGWRESVHSGSCIKLFFGLKSWYSARDACQSEGGDLVKIGSEEMNKFVYKYIESDLKADYWTGWNNRKQIHQFRWLEEDKQPQFVPLILGEGAGEQDIVRGCGLIGRGHPPSAHWTFRRCGDKAKFICQKGHCPPHERRSDNNTHGWWRDSKFRTCIKLFQEKKSWSDARATCRSLGGDLPKIKNKKFNTFLRRTINKERTKRFWIGLSTGGDGESYKWLGETYEPKWLAPHKNKLNQTDGRTKCGQMRQRHLANRSWWSADCSELAQYICERPSTSCLKGWTKHPRPRSPTCIKVFYKRRSWQDAKDFCMADGGDLLTVETKFTRTFLKGFIKHKNKVFWNGLRSRNFWHVYEDRSGENYTTQTYVGGHACAAMYFKSWRQYLDGNCEQEKKFICEKIPASCPTGWFRDRYTRTCITVFGELRTWYAARQKCEAVGGYLARFRHGKELNLLKYHLPGDPNVTYWIDDRYVTKKRKAQKRSEKKENATEEDDYDHCRQLTYPGYILEAADCNSQARFFCERSLVSPKRPRLDVDFDEPSEFVYVKQELFLNCSAYTLGDGVLSWMLKEWGKEPLVWMRVEDGRTKGHVPPGIVMLHKPSTLVKHGILVESTLKMVVAMEHHRARIACFTGDISLRNHQGPERDSLADYTNPLRVVPCEVHPSVGNTKRVMDGQGQDETESVYILVVMGFSTGMIIAVVFTMCWAFHVLPWNFRSPPDGFHSAFQDIGIENEDFTFHQFGTPDEDQPAFEHPSKQSSYSRELSFQESLT